MRITLLITLVCAGLTGYASDEGTRHITGDGADMYFMNDKVFGVVGGFPLWAIYNCGTDIKGEMDVKGTYHEFHFVYQAEGDKKITGKFGPHEMALKNIEKTDDGFLYHVLVGDKEHQFTIRYEKFEDGHLTNSIIEGDIDKGQPLKLTVDGRLCPFATTGIILISFGAALLAS